MKKLTLLYLSICLCLSATLSCKKELSPQNVTSLTIVSAISGSPLMLADFTGKPADQFSGEGLFLYYGIYDPNARLAPLVREQSLAIYKYPYVAGDPQFYKLTLNPKIGEVNTLFLTGTQSHPEHFVVNELPPYYAVKDSLVGLRFVNLSAGSGPVQVKISGQGLNTAIISNNLAYKSITTYLPVPANSKIGDLFVEFYDQASGTLLDTFTLTGVGDTLKDNPWRYRNYTLALKGLPNAANPDDEQGIFKIDDY